MELVLATRNRDKIKEIKEFFKDLNLEIFSIEDFKDIPEIKENGNSFVENSLKKARTVRDYTNRLSLSDDSGLVVFALNGRPGIHSSRYAGEKATYEDNINKLLKEMSDITDRKAKFVCVVSIVTPEGEEHILTGEIEGEILKEKRGESGFGYDPVFFVREYNMTFAEMSMELKNKISHRAIALSKAREFLMSLIK